jgi:hypothetical protein
MWRNDSEMISWMGGNQLATIRPACTVVYYRLKYLVGTFRNLLRDGDRLGQGKRTEFSNRRG